MDIASTAIGRPRDQARPASENPAQNSEAATALQWFDQLGKRVAEKWSATGNSEGDFVSIATEALDATPPSRHIDPAALSTEVLRPVKLVPQVDKEGRFSDLPVTVYDDGNLFIQVLHWVDASPAVHDHNFVGAFHVLSGSSIQSTYSFKTTRSFGPRMRQGILTPLAIEFLRPGATRPIPRGDRFIHGVFHLERPSISVVIRTHPAPNEIILAYDPPGLAWDIFYENGELARLLQSLRLHHRLGLDYFGAALRAIEAADEITRARILLQCHQLHPDRQDVPKELIHAVRARHRDLVDIVEPVLAELSPLHTLLQARNLVETDDLRYALAVLISAPTRRQALQLVAERVTDAAPEDVLTMWIGELMAYAGEGSVLQDHRYVVTEPEVVALRAMLEGKDDRVAAADVAAYFDGAAPMDEAGVAMFRRKLRSSVLLRGLVTEDA